MIYNHYLDLPPLDLNVSVVNKAADMCSEDIRNLKSGSSLVCTSRQIMKEALPLYQKLFESRIETCSAAIMQTWSKIARAGSRCEWVYLKRVKGWFSNAKKFSEMKLAKWEDISRVVMRKSGLHNSVKLGEREHHTGERRQTKDAENSSELERNSTTERT